MAEVTADRVCEKLNTQRECRTGEELLPHPFEPGHNKNYHTLGARLAQTEQEKSFGQLICECEMASRADIERSINEGEAKTLDDIPQRRATRDGAMSGWFLYSACHRHLA